MTIINWNQLSCSSFKGQSPSLANQGSAIGSVATNLPYEYTPTYLI